MNPLEYDLAGEGRPVVVGLHGNFASKRFYQDLIKQPIYEHRIIAPNLPGFGGSTYTGAPSIAAFADILEEFFTTLKLEQPVLIGHSFGGALALELALRQPKKYRALVLISSPSLTGFPHNIAGDTIREQLKTDRALLEKLFDAQAPSLTTARKLEINWEAILDDAQHLESRIGNGIAADLGRWNRLEHVAKLSSVPILVFGGARDLLVTPAMTQEIIQQIPHAKLEIEPSAGHWLPLEQATFLRTTLELFLAQIP
jgi:pimeloyl-ACP methyl ester carboxylesterase